MQILNLPMPSVTSTDTPFSHFSKVSELFQHMEKFLEVNFNHLAKQQDWTSLYVYLVNILVEDFNENQPNDTLKISAEDILIPYTDHELLAITRLLYQAIVPIRIGVADGQHRVLSLMNLLMGFGVFDSLSKSPPIFFAKDKNIIDGYRRNLSKWQMWSKKSTVRFVYPKDLYSDLHFTANFETVAQEFSKLRDTEQSTTRLRTLCDVYVGTVIHIFARCTLKKLTYQFLLLHSC